MSGVNIGKLINTKSDVRKRYDKETNIEIARSGARYVNDIEKWSYMALRIKEQFERVKYAEYDGEGQIKKTDYIDLSDRAGDISTLDGIEGLSYNNDIYEMQMALSGRGDYEELRQKRMRDRISESKNPKGCYQYSGIENPDISRQK